MGLSDFMVLAKKIVVGIVVTVVPLAILFGALSLTQSSARKRVRATGNQSSGGAHAN